MFRSSLTVLFLMKDQTISEFKYVNVTGDTDVLQKKCVVN